MALQFRRVVTGHNASGRAIVKIDEIAKNVVSSRPGATSCVVWTSQGFPVDNTGDEDAGLRRTGTTLDNGTVFRILELAPGASPRNHRTDSIDYAVVMSGEIDMELDDLPSISRPVTCSCSAAPFTTGSTAVRYPASSHSCWSRPNRLRLVAKCSTHRVSSAELCRCSRSGSRKIQLDHYIVVVREE